MSMATRASNFRVLVATDASDHARAAVAMAMNVPWPADTQVRIVVARRTGVELRRATLLVALDRRAHEIAQKAQRTLSRRWPELEAVVRDQTPVDAILDEADRFKADVIVLGWRGHGAARRLLMGSVSRGVVRGAKCAVLVVRRSARVRRVTVGIDGSSTSKRALALVGRLEAPARGRIILVSALESIAVPSHAFVRRPSAIAREVARENAARRTTAMRTLNRAAAQLQRAGWQTRTVLTQGEPLRDLLGTVARARSQLLVVGARGTSGVRRLLLGSVAEGALNRSPVPVLIAR